MRIRKSPSHPHGLNLICTQTQFQTFSSYFCADKDHALVHLHGVDELKELLRLDELDPLAERLGRRQLPAHLHVKFTPN